MWSRARIEPRFAPSYYQIGNVAGCQGKRSAAITAWEKTASLAPGDQIAQCFLALACGLGDKPERAREILDSFTIRRANGYASTGFIAIIHASLLQIDEAFRWFEVAVKERDMSLTWVSLFKLWKGLEPLTTDPRFDRMLRTIGMET